METRNLAGTDLAVSRLVLGTMTFGEQADEATSRTIMKQALDAGITLFDTAVSYSDGDSEEFIGRFVKPLRDRVLIATKVGSPRLSTPDGKRLSRIAIDHSIGISLRRLQTDYVDLVYLHMPDWDTPIEDALEAIADLIDAGKVRFAAHSNYAAWQVVEMIMLAKLRGWSPPLVAQQKYNLLHRSLEDEYSAASDHFGLSNLIYNPLAGGLLTGKHRQVDVPREGVLSQENYQSRYWHPQTFVALEKLSQIAADAGMTLPELAFRWLLGKPLVTSVILGVSTSEQLRANLVAADGPGPDPDTNQLIDEVWRDLRGPVEKYNR